MDKVIKKVLTKIENEGFEAYVVGGFVRDFIMGKTSSDIDICTNALPKDLHAIFPKSGNSNNYGGFNLKYKNYNIDITTYRKEITYVDRKPTEIEYINNLFDDLKRRDFTINAICMNKKMKIIDLLNAKEDISNKVIKMIGNVDDKINEDPLRILRAIRFATILNFKIDDELEKSIKKNAVLVSTLSKTRIKDELNKILLSKNYQQGLDLLKEYDLTQYLGISYNEVKYTSDLLVMWSQIETIGFPFTKSEKDNIIKIREIIKEKEINNNVLYKYGLYISLAVGEYLGYSKTIINKIYKELPIKDEKDLCISSEEIMDILALQPSRTIKEIKNNLITKILNKEIKNNNKDLKNYLKTKGVL